MRSILSLLVGALLATQACAAPAAPSSSATTLTSSTSRPAPPATDPVHIPKPPEVPPPKKDEGAGKYNSVNPKPADYEFQNQAIRVVDEARRNNMPIAAAHLEHYIKGKGKELPVNVDKMVAEIPRLQELVNYDSIYQGQTAVGAIDKAQGSKTFSLPWTDITPPGKSDWLHAMGTFKYSMTGVVFKEGNDKARLEYKVHVFKRYDWDENRVSDKDAGPGTAYPVKQLASLHLTGLAQEYIIRGSSCVRKVEDVTNAVLPPKPAGREKDAPPPRKPSQNTEYKDKGCKITASALRHRPCANTSDKCPAYGQLPKGDRVKFECYVEGQQIKGDTNTNKWGKGKWKDGKDHFWSLAYVEESCSKHIPKCK